MFGRAGTEDAEAAGPSTAAAGAADVLAPGTKDWATRPQANLSEYYVKTEGVLLQEFGNFLGKMCDRIDQQVQKGGD